MSNAPRAALARLLGSYAPAVADRGLALAATLNAAQVEALGGLLCEIDGDVGNRMNAACDRELAAALAHLSVETRTAVLALRDHVGEQDTRHPACPTCAAALAAYPTDRREDPHA